MTRRADARAPPGFFERFLTDWSPASRTAASRRARIFHAFEPESVGKAGNRSGLGLLISNEIVTAHGGHTDVVDRGGGLTPFRVVLPRGG